MEVPQPDPPLGGGQFGGPPNPLREGGSDPLKPTQFPGRFLTAKSGQNHSRFLGGFPRHKVEGGPPPNIYTIRVTPPRTLSPPSREGGG